MTQESPLEVSGGDLLGWFKQTLPLGHKADITYKNGFLRGKWVIIKPDASDYTMNLAEIRVYGSKS